MKNKILIILLTLNILFFTGCNNKIFMPYEEEPLCNTGKETGYCGSVSDVYDIKIKEQKWR